MCEGPMLQDVEFGLKLLWREKAFSLTALITLALTIGVNTAIFTVLYGVILRPLAYPESERLLTLYNVYPGWGVIEGSNGVPDYLDRKAMTDVFDSVALIGTEGYETGFEGSPQRVNGEYVTPDYFRVLRCQPFLGRAFTAEEATVGKDRVVVLSYGLWKDLFAGDRNVVGRELRLTGRSYRAIGVMPEGFRAVGDDARLWLPFAFTPQQTSDDERHSNSWGMIARLKPGITVAQAQQRIDALNRHNMDRFPRFRPMLENAHFGTRVIPLRDELVKTVCSTLYLLQAAVGLVLLMGCINVANLMLVRSNVRLKELAVRHCLGAGRWRISRQLLIESLALAAVGGVLGIGMGLAGLPLLSCLGTNDLPRAEGIHLNGTVLAFTFALALLTGLVFGSVPLLNVTRRDLNDIFRQGGRTGTMGRRAMWTRSALVVCQVSLAFVLLIGSGLLTLSLRRVLSVSPGFKPENVLSARLKLPVARYGNYGDDARALAFIGRVLESIRAIPGVSHASATSYLPFSGINNSDTITIEGYARAPGENPPMPGSNTVGPDYFSAMSIPVLRGRGFSDSDGPNAPRVIVIDDYLAKKYWPGRAPIGAKIRRGLNSTDPVCTIVGVVGSVKTRDLAERNPMGLVYYPYQQDSIRDMHLVVKTSKDDLQVIAAIRREMLHADPELPLFDVKTMPLRLAASVVDRRAAMILSLAFGGLALILAAVGIYGVLAYSVAQRTRELGIRVALGAAVSDVLSMIAGQGLRLAAAGLVVGLGGALVLIRLVASMLFEVKPSDPGVFLGVAAVLMFAAMAACVVPCVRALRIHPANALRCE